MKPTAIPRKPLLSRREKIAFVAECILGALIVGTMWMLTSCTFPEEGTGAAPELYRPDRPGPYPSSRPDAAESSSSDDGHSGPASSSSTAEPDDTSEGSSSDAEGNPTESDGTSDGGSSSTGEPAEYEPAHCDMTCPDGDAIEPSAEQVGGTFRGCYCATPCDDDDECGPYEHCDPFFDRCTVPCMADIDCTVFDSPPGTMACTLWWDDAEHFTHFCAYWNEDAP